MCTHRCITLEESPNSQGTDVDDFCRRVAPRVDLMQQLYMQLMQRRRVITFRAMQDFLVEWDRMVL